MVTTIGATATTVNYSGGGGIGYTFNAGNTTLNETTFSLPAGVTLSLQGSSTQAWSYPNLHGDDTITTNQTGVRPSVAGTDGAQHSLPNSHTRLAGPELAIRALTDPVAQFTLPRPL